MELSVSERTADALCCTMEDGLLTLRVMHLVQSTGPARSASLAVIPQGSCKATWKREFKLPWREAGPLNHHDDHSNCHGARPVHLIITMIGNNLEGFKDFNLKAKARIGRSPFAQSRRRPLNRIRRGPCSVLDKCFFLSRSFKDQRCSFRAGQHVRVARASGLKALRTGVPRA